MLAFNRESVVTGDGRGVWCWLSGGNGECDVDCLLVPGSRLLTPDWGSVGRRCRDSTTHCIERSKKYLEKNIKQLKQNQILRYNSILGNRLASKKWGMYRTEWEETTLHFKSSMPTHKGLKWSLFIWFFFKWDKDIYVSVGFRNIL